MELSSPQEGERRRVDNDYKAIGSCSFCVPSNSHSCTVLNKEIVIVSKRIVKQIFKLHQSSHRCAI